MTTTYCLEIADILFLINHPGSIDIRESDPSYRSFFSRRENYNGKADVSIALEYGHVPETKGMIKIFDSEQSWSMYRDGNSYCLRLYAHNRDKSMLMARMDSDFTNVHIYCGDEFIYIKDGKSSFINPVRYPLDQLLLMYILSRRCGALIHASSMMLNGKGFIFPGRSGAGKSTFSRQFYGRDRFTILSDDRVVVRKIGNTFHVYGTPWAGEAGIAENKSCELNGIFFIYQGMENAIREITPKEAVEKLVSVTSIPWFDEKTMTDILNFCDGLFSKVPSYELHFTPDDKIVDFFEKTL